MCRQRLRNFYRRHASLWEPSEKIGSRADMDDPLLKTFSKARLAKARLRLRGSLVPPEEDLQEPMRTLRQLAHPLSCGCSGTPTAMGTAGDDEAALHNWLADVAGNKMRGIFYQYVRTTSTILLAFLVGFGAEADTMSLFGFTVDALSLGVVGVQVSVAAYCLCGAAAGDRLEGSTSGVEMLSSALNVLLLYIGGQQEDGDDTAVLPAALNATDAMGLANTTGAGGGADEPTPAGGGLGVQDVALILSCVSVVLPLGLTVYDSIVLPALEAYNEGTPQERRHGCCCLLLRNLVVMPIILAANFFSFGTAADAAAEVIEDTADTAIETTTTASVVVEEKGAAAVAEGHGDVVQQL